MQVHKYQSWKKHTTVQLISEEYNTSLLLYVAILTYQGFTRF